MPKRDLTYTQLKTDLERGYRIKRGGNKEEISLNDYYSLTITLQYWELLDWLQLREKLGKNMSDLIRDAVRMFKRQHEKDIASPAQLTTEDIQKLIAEQKAIREEMKSLIKKEREKASQPILEGEEENWEAIKIFLGDLGPLSSKQLARYVFRDERKWRDVDLICDKKEDQGLLKGEGNRWVLVGGSK